MRYYIAEKGQPVGPFEPNELLAHGLTANSLVWGEGMPSRTSASQVPELMALLTGQPVDVTGTGGAGDNYRRCLRWVIIIAVVGIV